MLAIIPARGGSKGISNKNLHPLFNKPLIYWTINAAISSKSISRVIVSTDNQKIAQIAREFGAETPFIRPAELATDFSSTVDVVLHTLNNIECSKHSHFILLQPTSPLRNFNHINESFLLMKYNKCTSCISFSKTNKGKNLYFIRKKRFLENMFSKKILISQRRQDNDPVYVINGAIYIFNINYFKLNPVFLPNKKCFLYEMSPKFSVDIDTITDLLFCEYLLKNGMDEIVL